MYIKNNYKTILFLKNIYIYLYHNIKQTEIMKVKLTISKSEYDAFYIICKESDLKHEIIQEENEFNMLVEVELLYPSQLYYLGTLHQIQKSIQANKYRIA